MRSESATRWQQVRQQEGASVLLSIQCLSPSFMDWWKAVLFYETKLKPYLGWCGTCPLFACLEFSAFQLQVTALRHDPAPKLFLRELLYICNGRWYHWELKQGPHCFLHESLCTDHTVICTDSRVVGAQTFMQQARLRAQASTAEALMTRRCLLFKERLGTNF